MAKRNAKKQASREEIESSDPVCRKLALLADEAGLLLLTEGADYDVDEKVGTPSTEYGARLNYFPALLDEMMELRIALVLIEESKPESRPEPESEQPATGPSAHEGSPDATDDAETEHE